MNSREHRLELLLMTAEAKVRELEFALAQLPKTCCNCGNDDGPYPICLDCLEMVGNAP